MGIAFSARATCLAAGTVAATSICAARTIQSSLVFRPPHHGADGTHIAHSMIGGISYSLTGDPDTEGVVIIYSHGNAEDLCTVASNADDSGSYPGCAFLAYDYPGYGLSKGQSSESECVRALGVIVTYVQQTYPRAKIVLIGRSLGTGVVVSYAAVNNWRDPIVLLSPYRSIGRIACNTRAMDYLSGMFVTEDKISQLGCPVKIIHGTKDNIVPVSHGRHLYDLLVHRKQGITLDPVWLNCGHNNLPLRPEDLEQLIRMVNTDM